MKKLIFRRMKIIGVLLVALVIAGYIYANPGRGPKEAVDPHAKGYVEIVDGGTVVHLKGSPYEMGYQHGALLRGQVHAGTAAFNSLLQQVKDMTGIPLFMLNFGLDCVYRMCMPHIPAHLRREMEGLADGAGADLKTLRRVHIISEVSERNCSSFVVFGDATHDGRLYHGHNFDWNMDAGIQDNAALFLYEPDDGVPFAAYGYIGMIGYVSGMNMEGISVGFIGAVTRDGRLASLPLMLMLRRVLQEARSVEDAEAIIAGAQRGVGYNYVIADGDAPGARAFETTANHFAAFSDDDPKETCEYAIRIKHAVIRSDEAMDPLVRSFQKCANGYPNMPYGSNSYEHRYKGMAERIQASYGAIDADIALDIVKAVAMRKTNLHSVVCDTTHRQMWAAHAAGREDAWKQDYVHFDLKTLFLPPEHRGKEPSAASENGQP